jgi:ABC-type multidrug transport system fused ATPase/permease subunit
LFCIQRWLGVVLALMVAVVAVCLVAFSTQFSDLTTGNAVGVALLNVFSFSQTLTLLITAYTSLEMALGAVVRIKNYVAEVKPEDDPSQGLLDAFPEYTEATTINLKNVTISYE